MSAATKPRLVRVGGAGSQTYFVNMGAELVGRVRYNDGWNAAIYRGDGFDSLGGTWRSRFAAVHGLLDEWRPTSECPSCGGSLQFVAVEGDGDTTYICTDCGDEWFLSTLEAAS